MNSILIRTSLILLTVSLFYTASSQCRTLIWSDEFNGATVDETKWEYYTWGWGGGGVQNCYRRANVAVNNGSLKLTAKYDPAVTCDTGGDFSSGFIQTRNRAYWTYGYFEARIKLPASNSTWPAFWMSPQDSVYGDWPRSGEIDIFEARGHNMSRATGNAHWGISRSNKQHQPGHYTFNAGNDGSDWHVYAVEWNPGELKFYIDDIHYHTINDFDQPNATTHPGPFNIDFYLRLNLAVGGNYLNEPWNDANNAIDQLPATMEVDWVKVYENEPDCGPTDPVCELITNGDFSDGTNNWTLYKHNGTDGSLTIQANGFLKLDVITTGTSDWMLALRQSGIALKQGKTYTIEYDAYADAARTGSIIMSRADGTQYCNISQSFTTSPTHYTEQFAMNSADDLIANFNLNVGSTNVDIYVNNISISEDGCIPPCENPNLISNPSFENDFSDWTPRRSVNAQTDFSIVNNSEIDGSQAARIQVNMIDQNYWDVQLLHFDLNYNPNEMYELSFAIKSDQENLQFSYGSNQGGSHVSVFSDSGISTSQWQVVNKIFSANTANTSYLFLNFGYSTGTFYIDNVQIRKICEQDPCNLVVSNINDSGPGSLRDAIECAEDGSTIIINDDLSGDQIVILDTPIQINKNLNLQSNPDFPTYVDASNVTRIFEVDSGLTFNITNVHLIGGQADTGNVMINNGTVNLVGLEVFNSVVNPFSPNSRLAGSGEYILMPDVMIHK